MNATKANCVVCGEPVLPNEQAEHLRTKHAAPAGGFPFWINERKYRSPAPSMTVGELLKMTDSPVTYQFEDERGNSYSHENSVDLTRDPHFSLVPPATYYAR